MPANCKSIREFNFLHLIGAMGEPKDETEKCLIENIKHFESDNKKIIVGMFRYIRLMTEKKGWKTDSEKKREFWRDIARALEEKNYDSNVTLHKAAEDPETGLDLYKRISGYTNQFSISFPTKEIAEYFFEFFYVLIEPDEKDVSVELDARYDSINSYMAKKRLEKFLKKLPASENEVAHRLMEGSKNENVITAKKVRAYIRDHMQEIYDHLSQ